MKGNRYAVPGIRRHILKRHVALGEKSCGFVGQAQESAQKSGVIKWSFGGSGNCSNLNEIPVATMKTPEFENLFTGFEWPWHMPAKVEKTRCGDNTCFETFRRIHVNAVK